MRIPGPGDFIPDASSDGCGCGCLNLLGLPMLIMLLGIIGDCKKRNAQAIVPSQSHQTQTAKNSPNERSSVSSDQTPSFRTARGYQVVNIQRHDTLNVRSGPGASYSIVARLAWGTKGIQVTGQPISNGNDQWIPVILGQIPGWVNMAYLRPDN
jgi:hypothetical protein